MRSSVISDGSWIDFQLSSPLSSEIESLCSEQSFDCSEERAENTNEKTLIAEKNFESDVTLTSKDVMVYSSNIAGNSKIRKSRNLESNCELLLSCDSEATSSRPSSDAYSLTNTLCRTSIVSPTIMDTVYNTGSQEEDQRLKKLHYAAVEIYTVEKKFVEQLELIAVVSI